MEPIALQVAQGTVDWLAYFALGFVIFITVEWLSRFFRRG